MGSGSKYVSGVQWTVSWEDGTNSFTLSGFKYAGTNMPYGSEFAVYVYFGSWPTGLIAAAETWITPTTGTAYDNFGSYDLTLNLYPEQESLPTAATPVHIRVGVYAEGQPGGIWPTDSDETIGTWYPLCTVTVEERVGSSGGDLFVNGTHSYRMVANGRSYAGDQIITQNGGTLTNRRPAYTYNQSKTREYTARISGDTTLYVIYDKTIYSVTFDANKPSGISHNMPTSPRDIEYGGKVPPVEDTELPTMEYTVTLHSEGGIIVGDTVFNSTSQLRYWRTAQEGGGSIVEAYALTTNPSGGYYYGTDAADDDTVTLYAYWKPADAIQLPTPTKEGYIFRGWGLNASATEYVDNLYIPNGTVDLYAVWAEGGCVHIFTADGYKTYAVWVYLGDDGGDNNNGWHRATPMIYCTANGRTGWHSCG